MQRLTGIFALLGALLLLTGSVPQSQEQTKKKAATKVQRFLEVSGLRQSYEKSLRELPLSFVKDFGPDSRATLQELVTKKDVEKLMGRLERKVKKSFSEDELGDLIKFYETPIGKKLARSCRCS